jgi:hypothetical protein
VAVHTREAEGADEARAAAATTGAARSGKESRAAVGRAAGEGEETTPAMEGTGHKPECSSRSHVAVQLIAWTLRL